MKINPTMLRQQLEHYIEEAEISVCKTERPDEIKYLFPLFSDDEATFFAVAVWFSGNEVIGAISAPLDLEEFLLSMSDGGCCQEYRYIYPISDEATTWNDMEFPIMHLFAKANELYNSKEGF